MTVKDLIKMLQDFEVEFTKNMGFAPEIYFDVFMVENNQFVYRGLSRSGDLSWTETGAILVAKETDFRAKE
jgi:hypothetical protein